MKRHICIYIICVLGKTHSRGTFTNGPQETDVASPKAIHEFFFFPNRYTSLKRKNRQMLQLLFGSCRNFIPMSRGRQYEQLVSIKYANQILLKISPITTCASLSRAHLNTNQYVFAPSKYWTVGSIVTFFFLIQNH